MSENMTAGIIAASATPPVFPSSRKAVALGHHPYPNHLWETIIYSVGIVYRATFLNSVDRHRGWKMYAT
ncbi:MAG: hypothetical protein HYZ21_06485 [Chloroflexi bacterium]|nr:hypothetical protein [Chloroflexota bacterium]